MVNDKVVGLIAAPFTPLYADGSLNTQLIPKYYNLLKANNVNGAFICGSTGEGVSLTLDEKKKVIEKWGSCIHNDPDFTLMAFVGGTCLADCKDLALFSRDNGLSAVSFTAPYYFKPANVEMLAQSCYEVASSVPNLPFYYYHIPVLTGTSFNMIDLLKTVDGRIPNFAGIKYTQEDFMDFLSCINFNKKKYNILWGRDENMLAALALGAKGAVGSTYNYAAPLYLQMIEAFEQGDFETARKLQQTSIDMIALLGKYGGISTGKAYMKAIGLDCGQFRLPVKNMTPEQFDLFIKDTENLKFKSFASKMPL